MNHLKENIVAFLLMFGVFILGVVAFFVEISAIMFIKSVELNILIWIQLICTILYILTAYVAMSIITFDWFKRKRK